MKRIIGTVFTAVSVFLIAACGTQENRWWLDIEAGNEDALNAFIGQFDATARGPGGRSPLHFAAENNNVPFISFFLALGVDPDDTDDQGRTALGAAAQGGHTAAAARLVAAGADIHLGPPNANPIGLALEPDGEELLAAILTQDSINSTNAAGETILHIASERGHNDAVRAILTELNVAGGAARVLVIAGQRATPLDMRDNEGRNPLDIALARPDSRDHMEVAAQLIVAGASSQGPLYFYFSPAARNANFDMRRADGLAPLHFAASQGYTGLVHYLLQRGASVNIQNHSGAAPLHEAARAGSTAAALMLLQHGAEVNAQDAGGNTALHIAVPAEHHISMISLLTSWNIDLNRRDIHGDTPLHVLVRLNRSPDVMRSLLWAGSVDVSVRNIRGQTALYLAVEENRIPLVQLLLESGSDIFAADNSGVTPFHVALRQRGAVLDALITSDTVRQTDNTGNTILHIAMQAGIDTPTLANIVDRGAGVNVRNRDGDTALHIAARLNRRDAGEFILERGADIFYANAEGDSPLRIALTHRSGVLHWMFNPTTVGARDATGNTMLHYVALWRMDAHIPLMIQQGISTESVNATGETPLFWAVHHDGASTVRALLAAGANLNARDSIGNSALHSAVRWNAMASTGALLDAGINVNVHSLNGTTPLHDAVRFGNTAIASVFINRGADLEVRDSAGNTPFMYAVRSGYTAAADLLARGGASPMTRNLGGDTPLHFAVAAQDTAMINMLLGMNGVSIHARNTRDRTPFQIALTGAQPTLPALLGGNRINGTDDFGNSPLHVAIWESVPQAMLQTIIDMGSRLTAVDFNGRIPLRLAVDRGEWELARALADSGSDPFTAAVDEITSGEIAIARGSFAIAAVFSGRAIHARDPAGNTVLHHAARIGNPDAISQLLSLGADMNVRNISDERPADVAMRWNNPANAALLN